jgi:hypothetical protein
MERTIRGAVMAAALAVAAFVCMGVGAAEAQAPPENRDVFWAPAPVINQGFEPACVGYAWYSWLLSGPYPIAYPAGPYNLYRSAQYFDSWEGENYSGSNGVGAGTHLYLLGLVRETRQTEDVNEAVRFMVEHGPIIIEIAWTQQGNNTNSDGYVKPGGEVMGWHEVYCYSYHALSRTIGCSNSWGTAWGDGGRFKITTYDLQYVINSYDGGFIFLPDRVTDWVYPWGYVGSTATVWVA